MAGQGKQLQQKAVEHVIFPAVTPEQVAKLGPIVFTRGEGIYLWDTEGKRYMDSMSSGVYAVHIGYGREEMARSRLERFHSPEVVDLIINGEAVDEKTLMAPKEKYVTVLFTDIVSFTPLSERLTPGEVSHLLNQYFHRMTDVIFDYRGTLDKYVGDAIMAVFGAPIERADDAERAVQAALDMRKALFEMMEEIEPERRFHVRLGINTGRVVAGNLGSPRRMDYSIIGDTVNTASRLESIAEPNQILMGQETYAQVKGKFEIRRIGNRLVKGKTKALTVYEVLDAAAPS